MGKKKTNAIFENDNQKGINLQLRDDAAPATSSSSSGEAAPAEGGEAAPSSSSGGEAAPAEGGEGNVAATSSSSGDAE